jgi:hypothetical protein
MQPISHIRPMTLGEILDSAFKLYRGHFLAMYLSSLIAYAPFVLMGLGLAILVGSGASPAGTVVGAAVMLAAAPLSMLGFAVSWGSGTHLASEAYMGRPVTVGDGVRRGFRHALPLLGAMLVVGVLMMLGFVFFIVPGFIVAAMAFAVIPAVVVEGRGPVEAFSRSRELARGSLGRILGVMFVAGVIASLPGGAVSTVDAASALANPGAPESVRALLVTGALKMFMASLATPFSTAVYVLLYYDRRVRTEALDVQLMAERLPVAV